jgi:hypothetical protein
MTLVLGSTLTLGSAEGFEEGFELGAREGWPDGDADGFELGATEGWSDGAGEGSHVIPTTDTVKVHVPVLPILSVAVMVTGVFPRENKSFGLDVADTVGLTSQSSDAPKLKLTRTSVSVHALVYAVITLLLPTQSVPSSCGIGSLLSVKLPVIDTG